MEIHNIPQNLIKGVNQFGNLSLQNAKNAGKFVKNKADLFVKNPSAKAAIKEINQDTIVGAGIILVASTLAFQCFSGIVKKISELKNEK